MSTRLLVYSTALYSDYLCRWWVEGLSKTLKMLLLFVQNCHMLSTNMMQRAVLLLAWQRKSQLLEKVCVS